MEEAVGILEVYGLACAFLAADAGCKAASVRLEPFVDVEILVGEECVEHDVSAVTTVKYIAEKVELVDA